MNEYNAIFWRSFLCRYKQYKYTLQYFWRCWVWQMGPDLNADSMFKMCRVYSNPHAHLPVFTKANNHPCDSEPFPKFLGPSFWRHVCYLKIKSVDFLWSCRRTDDITSLVEVEKQHRQQMYLYDVCCLVYMLLCDRECFFIVSHFVFCCLLFCDFHLLHFHTRLFFH